MKSQNCIAAKYAVAIEVAKTAPEVYNHLVNDVPNFWPEEFEGQSSKPMMCLYSGQEMVIIQRTR